MQFCNSIFNFQLSQKRKNGHIFILFSGAQGKLLWNGRGQDDGKGWTTFRFYREVPFDCLRQQIQRWIFLFSQMSTDSQFPRVHSSSLYN